MKNILIITILLISTSFGCSKKQIEIQYSILRDRVIVTDQVMMKKALYVGFMIADTDINLQNAKAEAQLLSNNLLLAESTTVSSGERTFNIVFDLPYDMNDELYTIKIRVLNELGELIAEGSQDVKREDLKSTASVKHQNKDINYQEIPAPVESQHFSPSTPEKEKGYTVFTRFQLEYVFPGAKPKQTEVIDQISLTVCRNEFEPITFTVHPLQDLGLVTISIDDLDGQNSIISKEAFEIAFLEDVEQTAGFPAGQYQKMPRLIRPGNKIDIKNNRCQRFWITLKIEKDTIPGLYESHITISPQHGESTQIPLMVKVAPVTLEDIPGVDYFMLMTYEFTELTMPWSEEDKQKIYKSACNVLKSYRNHGMTTLCIHSPFIRITKENGTTNFEDIYAALRAARDIGFSRPIIWYMGHLIQTSKPKHPGNILGFEESIHIHRLKELVENVQRYARENDCPEVIFLPIDEADDEYQDPGNLRNSITSRLLKAIKESGGLTMLTARQFDQFKPVDFLCSSTIDENQIKKTHRDDSIYWSYNNKVTTDCVNPSYARFIYGYYTWALGVDGMSSWTFQNTQNASGNPVLADTNGTDIYVAYPNPDGPCSTLEWEAIREGIEDYKLIYKLECKIDQLEKEGNDSSELKADLQKIKNEVSSHLNNNRDFLEVNELPFRKYKEEIINLL